MTTHSFAHPSVRRSLTSSPQELRWALSAPVFHTLLTTALAVTILTYKCQSSRVSFPLHQSSPRAGALSVVE